MEKKTRTGFLTDEQEQIVDQLIPLKGVAEMADGPAIKLADNKGLESVKQKIIAKWGADILPDIYEVVDLIFIPLKAIAESQKANK